MTKSTGREKAFLPLMEEDSCECELDTPVVPNHDNPKAAAEVCGIPLGNTDRNTRTLAGVVDSNLEWGCITPNRVAISLHM